VPYVHPLLIPEAKSPSQTRLGIFKVTWVVLGFWYRCPIKVDWNHFITVVFKPFHAVWVIKCVVRTDIYFIIVAHIFTLLAEVFALAGFATLNEADLTFGILIDEFFGFGRE
jgi:hypothetical protein